MVVGGSGAHSGVAGESANRKVERAEWAGPMRGSPEGRVAAVLH